MSGHAEARPPVGVRVCRYKGVRLSGSQYVKVHRCLGAQILVFSHNPLHLSSRNCTLQLSLNYLEGPLLSSPALQPGLTTQTLVHVMQQSRPQGRSLSPLLHPSSSPGHTATAQKTTPSSPGPSKDLNTYWQIAFQNGWANFLLGMSLKYAYSLNQRF